MRSVFALVALLALPAGANADPARDLATLTQEVDRLEAADDGQVARDELNTLRETLGEARAHLEQGHRTSARRAYEQARARARLVAALLARARAEQDARDAHQAAEARASEAAALREEAFRLEQTLVSLEQAPAGGAR